MLGLTGAQHVGLQAPAAPHGGSCGTVVQIALVVGVADFVLRVKDEMAGGSC